LIQTKTQLYEARVGINLHYYDGPSILEVHRIIPWIANRIWVVSVPASDPYYDERFSDLVTFTDERGMPAAAAWAAGLSPEFFDREVERRYRSLQKRLNSTELLVSSGALGQLEALLGVRAAATTGIGSGTVAAAGLGGHAKHGHKPRGTGAAAGPP
jgi:hypothetical protein